VERIELTEDQQQAAADILDGNEEEAAPVVEEQAPAAPEQESAPVEEVAEEEAPLPELSPEDLQDLIQDDPQGNDPWAPIREQYQTPEELQSIIEAGRNTTAMQAKAHERNEEARRTMEAAERREREALAVIDHVKSMDAVDAAEFIQQYQDGEAQAPVREQVSNQDSERLRTLETRLADQQVSGFLAGVMSGDLGVERQSIKDRIATNLYNSFWRDPEVQNANHSDPAVMHQLLSRKMPEMLRQEQSDFKSYRREVLLDALDRKGRAQSRSVPNGKGPKAAARSRPPAVKTKEQRSPDDRRYWEQSKVREGIELLKEMEGG
jgi:hypothetical protein